METDREEDVIGEEEEEDGGNNGGNVNLSALPEGCVANILSFTTPVDVCRLSLVSSTFKSAAESDAVWESFIRFDCFTGLNISTSSSESLKDLYIRLCDHPMLFDGGTKGFWLEKISGKKCYMLCARDLFIVWGSTPRYWRWISTPGARFGDVAELIGVCWLEIRGKINTSLLSPATHYAVYLIFKRTTGAYGFQDQPVQVSVGLVDTETYKRNIYLDSRGVWDQQNYQIVPRTCLSNQNPRGMWDFPAQTRPRETSDYDSGQSLIKQRKDGWLEAELGEFFNGGNVCDGKLEISVLEVEGGNWKGGIIIQGIEIRPKPLGDK